MDMLKKLTSFPRRKREYVWQQILANVVLGFFGLDNVLSKGYWPEARGYVIYSPCVLPEGAARGQCIGEINHITTS